jgi:hypothetical protein
MITIPKPCSENWNKMSKTDKGRFCEACHHEVVDFRKMANDKIEHYFQENQSKNICGNFKTLQVVTHPEERSFKNWLLQLNFKPLNYAVFALSFLVSGCMMGKRMPAAPVQEDVKIDTVSEQPTTTIGTPIYTQTNDSIDKQ